MTVRREFESEHGEVVNANPNSVPDKEVIPADIYDYNLHGFTSVWQILFSLTFTSY